MPFHESALSRSWRDTKNTRHSITWWIAAVIAGAALAVAGYFAAPGGASFVFALAGVVAGFFAPYGAALVWNMLGAYGRGPDSVTRPR